MKPGTQLVLTHYLTCVERCYVCETQPQALPRRHLALHKNPVCGETLVLVAPTLQTCKLRLRGVGKVAGMGFGAFAMRLHGALNTYCVHCAHSQGRLESGLWEMHNN